MSWLFCIQPAAELRIPRLVLSPPNGREHCLKTLPMDDGTEFCSIELGRITCPLPVVLLSYSESHF